MRSLRLQSDLEAYDDVTTRAAFLFANVFLLVVFSIALACGSGDAGTAILASITSLILASATFEIE